MGNDNLEDERHCTKTISQVGYHYIGLPRLWSMEAIAADRHLL